MSSDADSVEPENFELDETDERFGLAADNYQRLNENLRPKSNDISKIDYKHVR